MAHPTVRILSPGRQPLLLIIDSPIDIGREGDGLLLADDRISRRHARLEPTPDGSLRIVDLDSANGIEVDGVRVPTALLSPGESAMLGDTELMVSSARTSVGSSSTVMSDPNRAPTMIEQVAEAVANDVQAVVVGVADEPGTLTIAFSDIESSTERGIAVGDVRWMEILAHHNALVAAHVDAHNGRIIKNQGDGFMLCFRSARQGVLAAIGLQRDLAALEVTDPDLAVRVRIGLHTGEVLQDDDGDIFGRHVVVAARIGALANGGQILVSNLLKQIAEPRGDLLFGPPVDAALKGVDGAYVVHDVDWKNTAIQ
jgi:class 3 adenylate cyclase